MDYQVDKFSNNEWCYSNDHRTAIVEGKSGDWVLIIYNHPAGLHAWDKRWHTVQLDKAKDAAILWVQDGTAPGAERSNHAGL